RRAHPPRRAGREPGRERLRGHERGPRRAADAVVAGRAVDGRERGLGGFERRGERLLPRAAASRHAGSGDHDPGIQAAFQGAITRAAWAPPKPRLVETAGAPSERRRAPSSTRSIGRVGSTRPPPAAAWTRPARSDRIVATASSAPEVPSRWPTTLLVAATGTRDARSPKTLTSAAHSPASLSGVPVPCAFT